MKLDWWTIGLQTVNFIVLVWLLNRFLYKPVLGMIDARKAEVQRQYDDARAADNLAQSLLSDIESQRTGMASERAAVLKAAAEQARGIGEARRSQAQRDADVLLDVARKALATERELALEEARRVAVDLGSEIAQRLLADLPLQLRAEAWIERIEDHISGLPEPDRDALSRQLTDGESLTVVTAVLLPAATADAWRERLRRPLGRGINIAFEVKSELIAGAELHFPMAVLRFSWQSALDAARAEVGGHVDAH
jgi:F-type H+-transporting ATPase subunit b